MTKKGHAYLDDTTMFLHTFMAYLQAPIANPINIVCVRNMYNMLEWKSECDRPGGELPRTLSPNETAFLEAV